MNKLQNTLIVMATLVTLQKEALAQADKNETVISPPAYMMITYNVRDWQSFKAYPVAVAPLLKKYNAKLLAMDTSPKVLEGAAKMMTAIAEFPSREAAVTFYNDPEYQSIIHLRHNSTSDCTMMILNGFGQSKVDK